MTNRRLKGIFEEAAELARAVPPDLREAAFNRAVDAIMDHQYATGTRFTPNMAAFPSQGGERLDASRGMWTEFDDDAKGELLSVVFQGAGLAAKAAWRGGEVLRQILFPDVPPRRGTLARTQEAKRSRRRTRGREHAGALGAMQDVATDLLAIGFFNTARTLSEVVDHLQSEGVRVSARDAADLLAWMTQANLILCGVNRLGRVFFRSA